MKTNYCFLNNLLFKKKIINDYIQNKFTILELYIIKKIWKNLTKRSNFYYINKDINKGINIDIFCIFTNIDGLLGIRLFDIFDIKSNGYINLDNFINGLEIIYFSSNEILSNFLFKIFDINKNGKIEKKNMSTIINSIPHKFIYDNYNNNFIQNKNLDYEIWTNNYICIDAFNKFDIYHNEYLNFEEFNNWIISNNILINYIKTQINLYVQSELKRQNPILKKDILFRSSKLSELSTNIYESYMWKKGKKFGFTIKRYFLLYGSYLYYYKSKSDIKPINIIFLSGLIINSIDNNLLEISDVNIYTNIYTNIYSENKILLKCENVDIRNEWIYRLQEASQNIPFENIYKLGKQIGIGGFSSVHKCIKITDSTEFAVKIIVKENMKNIDKIFLKNEISILKLIYHPNIIHMKHFFESKTKIYFVIEFIKSGDLFNNIINRKTFTDNELKNFTITIAECLVYLHELGIVHRDIKPENILYDNKLNKFILTDFGLSRIILPNSKLYDICGTINYISPEIINLQEYGIESDIWSFGIILYLVYFGLLPFNGENKQDIINNIINNEPFYYDNKNLHANNLISKLLEKNPNKRITAKEILIHPFILSIYE
jgi:Ca2+-binding EF-hand superfamily protein